MEARCDIVTLTWNQLEVTQAFIESILANTKTPCRLIIIDNASSDKTPEYLKTLTGTDKVKIEVVLNKENRGFVGGMNQGIGVCKAPFICLANNDLTFTPGWLEEIISVFDRYPDLGVLNPNSNNLGTKPADKVSLEEFAAELKAENHQTLIEMPFCIGFCMVIRAEVVNRAGGLSEEFAPFFFEDSDYSLKAKKAGFRIGMAKGSYVWHREHASLDKTGSQKEQFFIKSREAFIKKWGKSLRVAWIAQSQDKLMENLEKGVALSRKGNFVSFLVKGLSLTREDIFKKLGLIEHSGVKFVKARAGLDMIWKVLIKKKRYDLIICDDPVLERIFKVMGYPTQKTLQSL